jgi:hypothetical protein
VRRFLLVILAVWLTSATASATSIDREALRRVLRSANADVAACAPPSGRYVIHLVIEDDGKVSDVAITDSPEIALATKSCILAAYRGLSFPAFGPPRRPTAPIPRMTAPVSHLPAPRRGTIQVSWPFIVP